MTLADPFDGMVLQATRVAGGGVSLDWTGGQPTFRVYRSTTAQTVLDPSNLIGTTDVRTFGDAPPPGAIFYYEIKSPCVYNPPEICNGIDDDCNGTIDGPGSEASCSLPHAIAQCVGGSCGIAACQPGFGDCDISPADGCEANLLSDSSHCGTCTMNCDASLGACTHSACLSGTCGAPFDRARCLAPAGTSSAGVCAFMQAGCPSAIDTDGDGLSDTWEDAGFIDINCDNVYDSNDVAIPDANKFVRDIYVDIAYMGPSTHLYPAQDTSIPGCPIMQVAEPSTGHRPLQDSIDAVVRAFAGAHLSTEPMPCGKTGNPPCPSGFSCVDFACLPTCNTDTDCFPNCNADCQALGGAKCVAQPAGAGKVCRQWRLHVDPLAPSGVAHHDILTYGPVDASCANPGGGGSMTPGDQASLFDYKTAPNFNPKEAPFKHFILFAHDNTCYGTGSPGCGSSTCPAVEGAPPKSGTSGLAEIKGNDAIVSLGVSQILNMPPEDRIRTESGTIMHELGHNLGLFHGGVGPGGGSVEKVNYVSVMNHLYQLTGIPYTDVPGSNLPAGWRLDFSHQELTLTLNESSLNEVNGIGSPGLQPPSTSSLIKFVQDNSPVCPCPINPCTGLPYPTCVGFGSAAMIGGVITPIDWNCNGFSFDTGIAADINGNGITGELHNPAGTNDWINLFYSYQCQASFADGATGPTSQ